MSKKIKDIGVISFLTVISRVLGLVRDQLAAAILGASIFNTAFLTAFRLPNLFRRLLGEGALTAAFVPTLQEELHENGRPGALALLNKVVSWLLVVTGGLVALAMLVFSRSRLIPGLEPKWYLAADLTVLLFPYLALVCIAAAFNATLNVFEHFTEPALSPIWLNLAMILSLGAAGMHFAKTPLGEVHWWCGGVLVGGFLQMAVPAGVLICEGWRPRFDLGLSSRVREIAALMTPGFLGTAIYQVNVTVSGLLAYSINDSAGTLLFYSNRLMELPIGVFAIAISTVVYPLIARHAVEKNFTAMAGDFRKGLRLVLVINVPAAAGLALLSGPIVRLLYQHGKFTAEDSHAMTPLLALFVVGLPFFSVVNLTVRAFYALKDTATPVKIAVIDFVVNLVLCLALRHSLGAVGLVVASTTAIIVQTLLLQRALARRVPGMHFGLLWRSVAKVCVATLVMSVFVWAGQHWLAGEGLGRLGDFVAVAGLIPLGVVLYGAVLWLLKIEGHDEFSSLLGRLRAKFF
ncbi:MAG TPA: murein biosynthesis integral membrane protein MurJ [Opitutaceae bacterium]|nr:murein biosynthesis integral membrane protein MurJ [Opitutaceae bacterium]